MNRLTSGLDLPYAHVHHHGARCVVGLHQRGEVAAVHLAHVLQVGLAVVWHGSGALFVHVYPAVCGNSERERMSGLLVQ